MTRLEMNAGRCGRDGWAPFGFGPEGDGGGKW